MLRFGFIAQKYTEIIGIGNKEFFDSIESVDHAIVSSCFRLKRSIPIRLRNIDAELVYKNLEEREFLPKTNLQRKAIFDYYMLLALNDPEVEEDFLNKLYTLKIKEDFKNFFIEILTYSLRLQNNLFNKTYINNIGKERHYMIQNEKGSFVISIDEDFVDRRKLSLKDNNVKTKEVSDSNLAIQTFQMNLILFFIHLNYYVVFIDIEPGVKQLEKIIFGRNQGELNIQENLVKLNEMCLIEGVNDGIIRLTDSGVNKVSSFITKYWDVIESASQKYKLGDSEIETLLCKFIVENMSSKVRIDNAFKVIKFITNFNKDICWSYKFNGKSVKVPYHLLEKIDGEELICRMGDNDFSEWLLIDPNYSDYYKKRKADKVVYNGIVYRALDWERSDNKVEFIVSSDKGYVDFQATCGKMRNEIDYKISEYKNNHEELSKRLKYREAVMHKDRMNVANYFKKRVAKMGILMCTIIVKRDENNNITNARVPFIYRNDIIAEYPSFSGLVPSGAHQPGFLIDEEGIENKSDEIAKRAGWKVSAIRELGEELFDLGLLNQRSIDNLFDSEEYKITDEIAKNSMFFEATGIGIDMYLGLCSVLTALIIDYNDVMKFVDDEINKSNYSKEVLNKVKTQMSKVNDYKVNFDEGSIIYHDLNDELMEKVLTPFYEDEIAKPNEIPVMVPCGVLSLVFGKEKYDELRLKKIIK